MWIIKQVIVQYKEKEIQIEPGWEPFNITEGQGEWVVWLRKKLR